jgi:rRNA-processing protein FCF1
VEYFIGSEKGSILREYFLDNKNKFYTVECCLAEIKGWALKNKEDFNKLLEIMKANSDILSLNENDWISAGEERFKQREKIKDFGLIDSVILIKQEQLNCTIITGDKHFKDSKNVVLI